MFNNKVFFFVPFLISHFAFSAVEVKNSSGHRITVSFHGYICSSFDHEINYKPCTSGSLAPDETAHFPDLVDDNEQLTKKERALVPRIQFSRWLSYPCKIKEYFVQQFCRAPKTGLTHSDCPASSPQIAEGAEPSHPNVLMLLEGFSLSITEDYRLEILSGYEYFPKQYVECRLTHLSDKGECPALSFRDLDVK